MWRREDINVRKDALAEEGLSLSKARATVAKEREHLSCNMFHTQKTRL